MKQKIFYGLSCGLKFSHISLDTIAAIRKCDVVYTLPMDKFNTSQIAALQANLSVVRAKDDDTVTLVKTVLSGFEKNNTIGFLTYGNPALAYDPLQKLASAVVKRNIKVILLEAISSLDVLLVFFNLTLNSEIRLLRADRLLKSTSFTPTVNSILFCLGGLNLPKQKNSKDVFLSKIGAAYPEETEAYLVECYVNSDGCSLISGKIKNISTMLARASSRSTLFIPAVNKAGRQKPKAAEKYEIEIKRRIMEAAAG